MAISGTAQETVRDIARGALSQHLARKWTMLVLRGIAALLFGILAIVSPGATLLSVILVWGAYAMADGAFSLWAAATGSVEDGASRWWLAVSGGAGIAAGALAWIWPGATAMALLILIATWAILSGALQVWGAIKLRKEIEGEWMLGLAGVLSILLGVVLLLQPAAGAATVVIWIGAFAIFGGILHIALALRLRKLAQARA